MICFLISATWCWLMPSKAVRQKKSSFSKPIGKAPEPMAGSQIFTSFSSWSVFSGNSLRHVGNQPRHPIFFLGIVLKNPSNSFINVFPSLLVKKGKEQISLPYVILQNYKFFQDNPFTLSIF